MSVGGAVRRGVAASVLALFLAGGPWGMASSASVRRDASVSVGSTRASVRSGFAAAQTARAAVRVFRATKVTGAARTEDSPASMSLPSTFYYGVDEPDGITDGPNGALWFTNYKNDTIGRMTTSGANINYGGVGIDGPEGITSGPDGALWFTNFENGSIGRITPSGQVTNFALGGTAYASRGITSGPDGALWFTMVGGGIGRITTSGMVTIFSGELINSPQQITVGPDGNLWFTNDGDYGYQQASIGQITTSGTVTRFTGTGIAGPTGITAGPDGALWFVNTPSSSVGRMTTSGALTEYTASTIY
jgi:streptogramin lyase